MTTEHEAITTAGGDAARPLARHLADLHAATRPVLFGVAGGVAAGKSTVACAVVRALGLLGLRAEVLPTDAFLLP
ncbi:MAG: nucleoside/nucleotide kinase family protein, partial [Acidimicrobiia bacterium]|nr:nucleoside/nucleotide kinase family protein [Acidimicrobiia bacterium]